LNFSKNENLNIGSRILNSKHRIIWVQTKD
jgi:hypothetical protein